MKDIIIVNYTDPVCVWCWATEPVFRAFETRYPNVEIRYVMGGMVESMQDFADPANHIDGDAADVNGQVMQHWLESQAIHRMPIEPKGFALFSPEHDSTYPQNIACKAALIADPGKAHKYLRLMRVASIAQARQTARRDVQVDIAREAGIDVQVFEKALDDGSALAAFRADLGLVQSGGISAFPTFLVKSAQAREVMMRGFNRRLDFERVFDNLLGGYFEPLTSPPDAEVLDWLIEKNGPLSQEEIYQAFDFETRGQAMEWVQELLAGGRYAQLPAGNQFLLKLATP